MPDTHAYRKEHSEIVRLIEEVFPLLDFSMISDNADSIYSLFLRISGKLSPHLNTESKHLYPFLYIHQNNEVRLSGQKFYYTHKEIIKEHKEHRMKWPDSSSIQKKPLEFIRDSHGFLDKLRQRIDKENTVLFPQIEKNPAK